MRRLIVNADDFGLTSGVNRGIVEAHTHGIVTSATLMACGAQFEEAVALARQAPKLSVGCHVVLVDGSPQLRREEVSCLIAAQSAAKSAPNSTGRSEDEPRFRNSLGKLALMAATGGLDQQQIETEITAQIRKLQNAGIRVSHLDSHKHTHMFPLVFKAMFSAAQKCGIKAVRNPFEPILFTAAGSWKRQIQLQILRRYQAGFQKALAETGLATPDGCIGVLATGGLTQEIFCELMKRLPEGTWEFVTHPGYNDAELDKVQTRLRHSREKELEILTSDEVKTLLGREQIELISYQDFARSVRVAPEVPSPLTAKSD